ncbi:MAG: hypothetical protein E7425_12295 [Ruminococcaceae bacterium]|nr:hypothetical protein [Oscillospiraceae bacterium]
MAVKIRKSTPIDGDKLIPRVKTDYATGGETSATDAGAKPDGSTYTLGEPGHEANDAATGVAVNTQTGRAVNTANGQDVTGLKMTDFSRDQTDYGALAQNATSFEEKNHYINRLQRQAEAQGLGDVSEQVRAINRTWNEKNPTAFRSWDGSYGTGYYGQDEKGDVGYYADPERTVKLANGNWGENPNNRTKAVRDFYGSSVSGGTQTTPTTAAALRQTTASGANAAAPTAAGTPSRTGTSGTTSAATANLTDRTELYRQLLSLLEARGTQTSATAQSLGSTPYADALAAQRAESDAMAEELKSLYSGQNSPYAQALEAHRAAQAAAVEQAVSRLEGQKSGVEAKYAELFRQLYRDSMNSRRDLDQYLAAQGINGGAAESTRLGYAAAYADALRRGEQERIGALDELDRAIGDARLNGELSAAQTAAELSRAQTDAYADALRALISRGDTLAARDWDRAYQQNRDAVNDARYDDALVWERAYQLARDLIGDARYDSEWAYRMASDDYDRQLAAERLAHDREQDDYNRELQAARLAYDQGQDAYSRQLAADQLAYSRQQDAYNRALQAAEQAAKLGDYSGYANLGFDVSALTQSEPETYTPTFTVAQLQKELDFARKNGTALSPTAARDYEYYYGAPYGGTASQSGGTQTSTYNNGGLSRTEVKNVQRVWNAANPDRQIAVDGYWGPNSQSVTGYADAASARQGLAQTR